MIVNPLQVFLNTQQLYNCRLAGNRLGPQLLKQESTRLVNYVRPVTIKCTPAAVPPNESHDERNMRLARPQSPHLTIYKPQLTSMLSISHRITGGETIFKGFNLTNDLIHFRNDFNRLHCAAWCCSCRLGVPFGALH